MTKNRTSRADREDLPTPNRGRTFEVALLTGGGDKPYALGMAGALIQEGIAFEFIGSDDLEVEELRESVLVRFLNLRGSQRSDASLLKKATRLILYYIRLIVWAPASPSRIFHLLWNNKFEVFDRTLLLLYYRMLGKRLALTVHNVNIRKRDGRETWLNRFTLAAQYWIVDHLFVHTEVMKQELQGDFGVPAQKISVIPFGINHSVPNTRLTAAEARSRFELSPHHKTLLFFGNIAPYKGLEYLVESMIRLAPKNPEYRLIIAGRPKGNEAYWEGIQRKINDSGLAPQVIERIEYVPDEETEFYFKAADVLVLPYTHIFQSGVLFLGYNFGVPVVASDVGSLRDDIIEGKTGYVCRPCDPVDLARCLEEYFSSDLYRDLPSRRLEIKEIAHESNSWAKVSAILRKTYTALLPSS